nr:cytochrome c biogenesis protein CcsA [candidate division Zixibacteria bacterium]
MWWKILLLPVMGAVIIAAFMTPSPMNPGSAVGATDVYRIFYFHVPQAWVASLAFIISMFFSIRYLKNHRMDDDLRAVTAARLGLIFCILATVTGSIFARMTWGEFWNWSEIREVSIFILLIIYGAYFALRSALPNPETRAALSAVMSILFAVSALFLIFILPRIYAVFSQHPSDSIVDKTGQITMGASVAIIFGLSLFSFTMLFLWMYGLSVRTARLAEKSLSGS